MKYAKVAILVKPSKQLQVLLCYWHLVWHLVFPGLNISFSWIAGQVTVSFWQADVPHQIWWGFVYCCSNVTELKCIWIWISASNNLPLSWCLISSYFTIAIRNSWTYVAFTQHYFYNCNAGAFGYRWFAISSDGYWWTINLYYESSWKGRLYCLRDWFFDGPCSLGNSKMYNPLNHTQKNWCGWRFNWYFSCGN